MKVLLIAPPFYRLLGSHYDGLHLGITYIAAVLKEHGHLVNVYNADYGGTVEYANQRQLFENYPSYKAILNDAANPIWDEIKENISSFESCRAALFPIISTWPSRVMLKRLKAILALSGSV